MGILTEELWKIFFLSAVPFTELRLTIPLGIGNGLDPLEVYLVAAAGNFLPVMPLLLMIGPLHRAFDTKLASWKPYASVMSRLDEKRKQAETIGFWGLFFFVAVPLPGTGVYSGAVLAFLLRENFIRSLAALTAGMLTAGLIMTGLSMGLFRLAGVYGVAVLASVFIYGLFFRKRN